MRKNITVIIILLSFVFGVFAPIHYSSNTETGNSGVNIYKAEAKKKKKKKKKKTKKKHLTKNERKLANFAKSLVLPNDDKRTKISKIYNWITANISYDWDKYKKGNLSWSDANTPYETYKKRKGVCAEYSELLNSMLDSVGIESDTTSGFADGLGGWSDDDIFNNHDWNEVKLNGEILYMDATWDAGDDPSDYRYFLIPEKCINVDHLEYYSSHKLTDSEQIDYVNSNSAYFDQYCPNLKNKFVDTEEDDNADNIVEE